MGFQAKLKCTSVRKYESDHEEWEFAAVHSSDGKGNESWSKWTPSGSMKLLVTNPSLIGTIRPGAFYLVEVAEAP
jgi:hypothetical protein